MGEKDRKLKYKKVEIILLCSLFNKGRPSLGWGLVCPGLGHFVQVRGQILCLV